MNCPNCSAVMAIIKNADYSTTYRCEHCGQVIEDRPKTTSEKVFSFLNRILDERKPNDSEQEDKYLQILRDPNASAQEKKYANRELMRLAATRRARR